MDKRQSLKKLGLDDLTIEKLVQQSDNIDSLEKDDLLTARQADSKRRKLCYKTSVSIKRDVIEQMLVSIFVDNENDDPMSGGAVA